MGYGIQFTNENGNTLIDSDLASQMQITSVETFAGASSKVIDHSEEFFMYNRTITSGTYATALRQSFSSPDWSVTNNSPTTINLARLKVVANIGNSNQPSRPANDYGIELMNTSSSISFTDLYTKGIKILSIFPIGTVSGGATIYSGSTFTNIYVGAGGNVYNGGNTVYNNFIFDATDTVTPIRKILFENYINFFTTTVQQDNSSVIVVAEIRN